MSGQQFAEEFLLRRLRPADQGQAFVKRLHQPRQLHQKRLAQGRRPLRLDAHHEVAGRTAQAQRTLGIGPVTAHREGKRLAPHLSQEVAQVVLHRERRKCGLQLLHVALLYPQLRLLAVDERGGRPVGLDVAFGLLLDECFQQRELGGVDLDLVEVAFDDLLHQFTHARQELAPWAVLEVVECAGERGDAVDEATHRMLARREEARVRERDAQHGQLQSGDLACHLRGDPRVGQDLVEQAADHVDHHVVQRAAGGLA